MVTLGGLGSITGAVLAAVVLTILPEALRGIAEYRMILYSLLLIVMMLLRPQGLMGTRELPQPMAVRRGRRRTKGEAARVNRLRRVTGAGSASTACRGGSAGSRPCRISRSRCGRGSSSA
jgi:branched-chain amino acid transport system permease protein